MAIPEPEVPSIEVGELLARVDGGDRLLLLDVRNAEEFESWPFEGRRPVETLHVPYFSFIEDSEGSIARLPRDREIVVLCAQGGSSAMVVELLRESAISAQNVKGGMVAYGEYLAPVRVPLTEEEAVGFEIWQLNRRGKGCLSYVVRAGATAVVVDPSRHVEWYATFVATLGARIVHVFDTHVHADHLSGGPALAAHVGAAYFVGAGEGFDLRHPIRPLRDGDELRLGGAAGVALSARIMATPGHTPGSTSYLIGRRHLLTGDTVFVGGVGRPDLGGHVLEWGATLFDTLHERLAGLADDTVILPAHYGGPAEIGPDGVVAGRLGDLRRTVPEFQIASEDAFVAAMQAAVTSPPASYAEIIRTNLGLTVIDGEKATELELGKNQCAVGAGHGAANPRKP